MKSTLFAVLAAFVAASVVTAGTTLSEEQYQFLFTKWVQTHGKNYETTNSLFSKFSTFKANVDLIIAHNSNPNETYKMAINKFADLTAEEFEQQMGLKANEKKFSSAKTVSAPRVDTPCPAMNKANNRNIDWSKGFLPPVRDQGQCGSCWAFSAVGTLAGAWAAHHDGEQLPTLSEQQMVDCVTSSFDRSYISEGCEGGLMSEALDYVSKAGLCADADYPYTARDGACKSSSCKSRVEIRGYKEVHGDAEFVAEIQKHPVAIGIAASSSAFQFYSSGVVKTCRDRGLNHGVVLAGYFPEEAEPYYYVRNSWGSNWGDKGHIRLSTQGNQCGVATSPWDVVAIL